MNDPATILVLVLAAWKAVDLVLCVVRWMRTLAPALALSVLVAAAHAGDVEAALADRAQFPPADWWRYYYLDASMVEPENAPYLDCAQRLVFPSMAPRQPVLENCLPIQITTTLWRIDLQALGWNQQAWLKLMAEYPYSHSDNTLMPRADWALLKLADGTESSAYYDLVFPGAKTINDVFAQLGVSNEVRYQHGQIEGASGVSQQGVRLIRSFGMARGQAWLTSDYLSLAADQDPLEQPEGDSRFDGQEFIAHTFKQHLASGDTGGMPVFALTNAKGELVTEAPPDLVEDHTRFRGNSIIVNPASCMQCHASGFNALSRNEFRELIESGVQALADYEDQQALEAFHFANTAKELERANADYAVMVQHACGCPPDEAALAFKLSIGLYDAPLDLADAARELGVAAEELKRALGWASAAGHRLGARISSLAHGGSVPRDAWEGSFLTVQALYQQWEHSQ